MRRKWETVKEPPSPHVKQGRIVLGGFQIECECGWTDKAAFRDSADWRAENHLRQCEEDTVHISQPVRLVPKRRGLA